MSEPCPFEQAEAAGRVIAPEHFTVTREQYDAMLRFMESLTIKGEQPATYTPLEPWEGALLLDGSGQEYLGQPLREGLMNYVLGKLQEAGYEMCRRDPK